MVSEGDVSRVFWLLRLKGLYRVGGGGGDSDNGNGG